MQTYQRIYPALPAQQGTRITAGCCKIHAQNKNKAQRAKKRGKFNAVKRVDEREGDRVRERKREAVAEAGRWARDLTRLRLIAGAD